MEITIVGAGAVGGVLAGLLARAGHAVRFLAHGESLLAVRAGGVEVAAPDGRFVTGALPASSRSADLGACDLVIVAVKAWQVAPLAAELAPLVGERTLVVPVQNGVEARDELARALGDDRVLGGICHVLATRDAPGRVRYVGAAPQLTFGARKGGSRDDGARLAELAATLAAAGIDARVSADIEADLWAKLLFVEPLGSVGAFARAPVGVVRSAADTRAMLENAMREVGDVARARGVHVAEDAVDRAIARVDSLPPDATTSMHRDLVEGRPSELNEQTGAVVRIGKATGTPRAVHDALLACLVPLDVRLRAARLPDDRR